MKLRFWTVVSTCACSFQLVAHPLDNWYLRYGVANDTNFMHLVTYGGGVYVATDSHGTIFSSEDAQNWVARVTGIPWPGLYGAAYGNHMFVLSGYVSGSQGLIYSSADGTNWIQRASGTTPPLNSAAFGNGLFLANAGSEVLTSPDGTNWAPQGLPGIAVPCTAYGNGLFLLGSRSRGTNYLSTDGTNWLSCSSGTTNSLYTLGYGKGMFMEIDIGQQVLTSMDGSNWIQRGIIALSRPAQIAYGAGCFVVCGAGDTAYSQDAVNWTAPPSGYLYVGYSVAFAQQTFVIVGGGTKVIQSDPVLSLQAQPGRKLRIDGIPGQTCWVETATSLRPGLFWSPVTNFTLPSTPYFYTDTISPKAA